MTNLNPQQGELETAFGLQHPTLAEFVALAQAENKEISMEQAELIHLGTLRGESPAEHWAGKISPTKRLEAGEVTQAELDHAVELLPGSFVPVTIGAPKRCVDGRTTAGYIDQDPRWSQRGLGPQVQGGTTGDAIGNRLHEGYREGVSLVGDVQEYAKSGGSDFAPGDHTDDHASGTATGCGQIDGQERKILFYNDKRSQTLFGTMEFLFEKAQLPYPTDKVDRLKFNADSLNKNGLQYFKDKHQVIEWLKGQNPEAVEGLNGVHKEATVTLNFVSGTTFDRDHFNEQTNDNVHNFNLDVWNILEEHGEDAFFVLADAVATLMDLTDGSLNLYARVPKDAQAPLQPAA